MSSAYRHNGTLDRKYLRVCAVWKLLQRGTIGPDLALALLAERHSPSEMAGLKRTVEIWRAYPAAA